MKRDFLRKYNQCFIPGGLTAINSVNPRVSKAASQVIPALTVLLIVCLPVGAREDASPFKATSGSDNASPFEATDNNSQIPQSAPKLSTSKEYFARALTEESNKDHAGAVRDYTEALKLEPHSGEAMANRGASRFNMQDYEGALSDYNSALKYFPNNKAVLDLKAQAMAAINARNNPSQNVVRNQGASPNQMLMQSMMGGDFADPSTMIMRNAAQRGLITPPAVDYSDPASIIMENARRRGLIPANTPNP